MLAPPFSIGAVRERQKEVVEMAEDMSPVLSALLSSPHHIPEPP